MRIALLSSAKSIHTIKWATALSQRGHTVALFSVADHKAPSGTYPPQVELHYLKCGGGIGYWFGGGELKKLLNEFKPDILNAHYATGYGTLARKCGFQPLMLSVWGSDVYDFPNDSFFHEKLLLKNLKSASSIASTSHVMAEQVKKIYDNCSKKIYITPFGVDTEKFRKLREPLENVFTVGIVKALEVKYGVDFLIRAFALFKTRMGKEGKAPQGGIRLEIYGSGSQLDNLKRLSEDLNIQDSVRFYGAVLHSQVPHIISGFNIFCAPSVVDSESFGVAAVEAMACEIPVLVSDADGFREVVEDNVTGFIVKKRDYLMLANKMYTLACDRELRIKMGKDGRKRVIEKYDWHDNVTVMENAMADTVENWNKLNV